MISVIRTPLDTGVWAVATAAKGTTYIAIDDGHITLAGAVALEQVLNDLREQPNGRGPWGGGDAPRAA
ncbi:hypothetical protein ABZY81_17080 [Streptomyces sp. NPDC006514]|uniref:hypothetical protein n=1 Tax=Streptomyces sp. NPDC006514 TaxID=3154308 RepID=UPI0033B8D5E9